MGKVIDISEIFNLKREINSLSMQDLLDFEISEEDILELQRDAEILTQKERLN